MWRQDVMVKIKIIYLEGVKKKPQTLSVSLPRLELSTFQMQDELVLDPNYPVILF